MQTKPLSTNGLQPLRKFKQTAWECQICQSMAPFHDTVDFNKSCVNSTDLSIDFSGIEIDYYLCSQCSFCFAPDLQAWSNREFSTYIYNDEYELVDPDYRGARAIGSMGLIERFFGASKSEVRHVDYGGGKGILSEALRKNGWDSRSWDPFVNPEIAVADLGQVDLVTAFEVFEHASDISAVIEDINTLCKPDGILFFSTFLSDKIIVPGAPLDWWYASPRNGHISLFSQESLRRCLADKGFVCASISPNFHIAFTRLPSWASHLQGSP